MARHFRSVVGWGSSGDREMLRLWRGGSGGAGTLSAIGAARVRLAVGRRLFAEQAPRALTTADITEQQSRKAAIEDAVRRSANKAHAFIIASGIACVSGELGA